MKFEITTLSVKRERPLYDVKALTENLNTPRTKTTHFIRKTTFKEDSRTFSTSASFMNIVWELRKLRIISVALRDCSIHDR